jgi:TonB family protein
MSLRTSHWLIRQAARHAPAALAERLEEEWCADLAARKSPLSRLRFAIGCCWATRVIAWERQPSLVPATSSAVGVKILTAYTQHNVGFYSRRTMSLFLVIGAHAAVLIGLMLAVGPLKVPKVPEPFVATTLPNAHPRDTLQNVPNPTGPPVINFYVPEPLVPPVAAEPDPLRGDTNPLPPIIPDMPQPPPHTVTRVQGAAGVGFPDSAGFYPASAIRNGEQGLAVIKVCVNVKGRLMADPIAAQSSGFVRLDEAALKLARAGSGHYRPSTEDGVAVDSCYPVGVRFQLKN